MVLWSLDISVVACGGGKLEAATAYLVKNWVE